MTFLAFLVRSVSLSVLAFELMTVLQRAAWSLGRNRLLDPGKALIFQLDAPLLGADLSTLITCVFQVRA